MEDFSLSDRIRIFHIASSCILEGDSSRRIDTPLFLVEIDEVSVTLGCIGSILSRCDDDRLRIFIGEENSQSCFRAYSPVFRILYTPTIFRCEGGICHYST